MTELHVEVAGEGPPVVLVHGFTGAISTMAGVAERLVDDHRVISLDLVGHGRSPVPADPGAYTVDAMAADVAAVIDDHAAGSAHVVGYSMGGRVALTLACASPARVRTLTLIGATPGLAHAEDRAERRAADEALAAGIERDGLATFVDRWMANPLFASQSSLGPDVLAAARAQRMANDPAGLAASLRGGGTGSMTPLHSALVDCAVPVALVVGELDPKFRAIAESMHESLPASSVVVVPGAGHAAHLEAPDVVGRAIRALTA